MVMRRRCRWKCAHVFIRVSAAQTQTLCRIWTTKAKRYTFECFNYASCHIHPLQALQSELDSVVPPLPPVLTQPSAPQPADDSVVEATSISPRRKSHKHGSKKRGSGQFHRSEDGATSPHKRDKSKAPDRSLSHAGFRLENTPPRLDAAAVAQLLGGDDDDVDVAEPKKKSEEK